MVLGPLSPPVDFGKVQNFLFDLDGTLVDSSPCHASAYQDALRGEFPDLAERFQYCQVAGMTTEEAFRICGIDDASTLRGLVAAKRQSYRNKVAQGQVALFPGARDLLGSLKARGRRLIIVTGGSARSADLILRHCQIRDHFDGVLTADDVVRGKPAPDLFHLALARHSLKPEDCMTVEDALPGILASGAAGVATVAVNTSWQDEALWTFDNLVDLMAAIEDSHHESMR